MRRGFLERPGLAQPLALARFVALDLETTGPRMLEDRIISIGAVAVTERTVRHDDAFEALLRQDRSSAVDNILIHQIGGQQQLAGHGSGRRPGRLPRVHRLTRAWSRSAPSSTRPSSSARCASASGYRAWPRFIDLAALLPALFPGYRERHARRLGGPLRPAADRPPPRDRGRVRHRAVADDRARGGAPVRHRDGRRPARCRAGAALAGTPPLTASGRHGSRAA